MTIHQNIDIIKKACIAANPSIMELRPGIEILYAPNTEFESKAIYLGLAKTRKNHTTCWIKNDGSPAIEVKLIDTQILGRPIRLADVLGTIGQLFGVTRSLEIHTQGYGFYMREKDINEFVRYEMLKDSLQEQSEETLEFLANLLK